MTDKPADDTTGDHAAATVTPDLARPLSAIRDALALIERTAEDPASVRQYTQLATRLLADLERAIGEHEQRTSGRPARAASQSGHAPFRIVIVEDADDMREAMVLLLQTAGYEVFTANNGHDGVARILELDPRIAFVDLGLPGLDGYEVARNVRAHAGHGPYLVAMTGYSGLDAEERARSAGYDLQLTKPLGSNTLREVIQTHATRLSRTLKR